MKTIYLSLDQVLAIHHREVEKFGGSHGVRDLGLLESAVHRSQASFMGEDLYPGIFDKATAFMHSILMNHAFVDANKRTAIASTSYFLYLNGYKIKMEQKEVVKFDIKVEAKVMNLDQISSWLKDHCAEERT